MLRELSRGCLDAVRATQKGEGSGNNFTVTGCVNIAGMLLARGAARAPEIVTRMAIGGGRGVILREMLMESDVLGLLDGMAGISVGALALRAVKALGAASFGFLRFLTLDSRLFTAGAALLTGRLNPASTLRED